MQIDFIRIYSVMHFCSCDVSVIGVVNLVGVQCSHPERAYLCFFSRRRFFKDKDPSLLFLGMGKLKKNYYYLEYLD